MIIIPFSNNNVDDAIIDRTLYLQTSEKILKCYSPCKMKHRILNEYKILFHNLASHWPPKPLVQVTMYCSSHKKKRAIKVSNTQSIVTFLNTKDDNNNFKKN